jgi:hypothetical protein
VAPACHISSQKSGEKRDPLYFTNECPSHVRNYLYLSTLLIGIKISSASASCFRIRGYAVRERFLGAKLVIGQCSRNGGTFQGDLGHAG